MSRSGKRSHVKASRVGSTCIQDRGKPGYAPKLIPPLKRGLLSKYGYATSHSAKSREKSLGRAVQARGKAEIYKHVVALRTLSRPNKKAHSALNKDVQMMRAKYYPSRKKSSYKPTKK